MADINQIVHVGPLQVRLGHAAAYFYLHMAERQPVDADDEWFLSPEPNQVPDIDRVLQFLHGLDCLVNRLHELEAMSLPAGGPEMTEESVQYEFYEAAKATFGTEKHEIREFFILLYQLITETSSGPRWGQFVTMFGLDGFMNLLETRFTEIPGLPRL